MRNWEMENWRGSGEGFEGDKNMLIMNKFTASWLVESSKKNEKS
jgi:hypothetical protein